jgi:hypothetical protein
LRSVFLAHAAADHLFARRLAEFLEFGCEVTCHIDEGLTAEDTDLIDRAAIGLSGDILLLLLSAASWPARRPRERWEPILFEEARRLKVDVVCVLLSDCPFPGLLRRRSFFDASSQPTTAMRLLKRWVWQREREQDEPDRAVSSDLEELYASLADRAGVARASGALAARFAQESRQEFEAVLWVPSHSRTLAESAGELGAQLGLRLEDTAKENSRRIRNFLAGRRCLVVLDAPDAAIETALAAGGRTSTLVTLDPVRTVETPVTVAYARGLTAAGRYAEAYELFYRLMDDWVDIDTCARELTWICEHWDRIDEANTLRFRTAGGPSQQLMLF